MPATSEMAEEGLKDTLLPDGFDETNDLQKVDDSEAKRS